jgi:vitamin B12 transporter
VDGELGVPPNAIDDPADPFASRVRFERVEDQRGLSGQLSMQWDPEGPLEVRSWVYANRLDEDRRRYDDDSYDSMTDPRVSGTFRADNDSLLTGHALHAGWSLGRWGRLRGAFQTRREDFDTEGRIRDVRLGGGRFDMRDFDESSHQTVYNGGLEYEAELLPGVGFVVGYGHSFLDKDSGENDDASTFLAGASWRVRPGTELRGSVSRKVRFPSLRQLYEPGRGDPDLAAEHSWNYEIGFRQQLPRSTVLDVALFWMDVDDFIETDEATGLLANQDQYRFRGVEVALEARPFEALDLRASYSFLDSENRSSGTDQDGLQNRPAHRTAVELRYRLPYGFAFRAAGYYVADQVVHSRQAPVRQRGTGDYFVAEMRIAKTVREDRAWLYFGVDNVADASFQESYGVPGPGRVFFGGLEGRF